MNETTKEFPKCFDCKWPTQSKVAIACQCKCYGQGDYDKHQAALAEARTLQEQGVPLSDPRYYPTE